ncbi:hypothetical protein L6452_17292 [Arctium lappa]|uniref:Uncharacterized protein n=1 Tax=Arctium lappa TaxID=4217 RepID=A0ACB9C325_ARCLA|nr:hypothetical protein L6452_17292 [Arctium lappa]
MEHHMKLITSLGLLVLSVGFVGPCFGHTFYVGGKDGWVLHPHENYNHWAERSRFQVNDTLVFKYKKGSDSVLVVNEEGYQKCNKTNPKQTLDDGKSVFKFTRSGPFFFISGHDDKCENGEKLIIVVLAVRNRKQVEHSDSAPPTPPPTKTPALAPSTMVQGIDKPTINAPAPATNSAVTSTVFGGSVDLILGLGFVLGLVWF